MRDSSSEKTSFPLVCSEGHKLVHNNSLCLPRQVWEGLPSLSSRYMGEVPYEGVGLERIRNLTVRPWSFPRALGISRLVMGLDFVKTLMCFENPIVDHIVFI